MDIYKIDSSHWPYNQFKHATSNFQAENHSYGADHADPRLTFLYLLLARKNADTFLSEMQTRWGTS